MDQRFHFSADSTSSDWTLLIDYWQLMIVARLSVFVCMGFPFQLSKDSYISALDAWTWCKESWDLESSVVSQELLQRACRCFWPRPPQPRG